MVLLDSKCCLQCQSEPLSQTGSKRSPERSPRQRSSQHHFCVDHKGAESIPDDHCSQCGQSDASSSSDTAADRIPSSRSQPAGVHASRQASPSTGDQQRSSSHSSPTDQAYEAYKMSAVNKLVKELAHKQQECRKAKLHAVVSFKHITYNNLWQNVWTPCAAETSAFPVASTYQLHHAFFASARCASVPTENLRFD